MLHLETLVYLIIALVLISAIIMAYWKYVTLPVPFKGLIMFLLIVVAVVFIWNFFLGAHLRPL